MASRGTAGVAGRGGALSRSRLFAWLLLRVLARCGVVVGGAFLLWLAAGVLSAGSAQAMSSSPAQVAAASQVVPMTSKGKSGSSKKSGGTAKKSNGSKGKGKSGGGKKKSGKGDAKKAGATHSARSAKPAQSARSAKPARSGKAAKKSGPKAGSRSSSEARGRSHRPRSGASSTDAAHHSVARRPSQRSNPTARLLNDLVRTALDRAGRTTANEGAREGRRGGHSARLTPGAQQATASRVAEFGRAEARRVAGETIDALAEKLEREGKRRGRTLGEARQRAAKAVDLPTPVVGRLAGADRSNQRGSGTAAFGSAARERSGENLDRALSGAVDLASGIASAVGGQRLGEKVRDTLSGVADTVRSALRTALESGLLDGGADLGGDQRLVVPARSGHGESAQLVGGPEPSGGDPDSAVTLASAMERLLGCVGGCGAGHRSALGREWPGLGSRGPPVLPSDHGYNDEGRFAGWPGGPRAAQAIDEVLAGWRGTKTSEYWLAGEGQRVKPGKPGKQAYSRDLAEHRALVDEIKARTARLSAGTSTLVRDGVLGVLQDAVRDIAGGVAQDAARDTVRGVVQDVVRGVLNELRDLAAGRRLSRETRPIAGILEEALYREPLAKGYQGRAGAHRIAPQPRAGYSPAQTINITRGASGGCSSRNGVVSCTVASVDPDTGEKKVDRCVGTADSSGCEATVRTGITGASASCEADGCEVTVNAAKRKATSTCGNADCELTATVNKFGADATCQAAAGCAANAKALTALDSVQHGAPRQSSATAECVSDCVLSVMAGSDGKADTSCQTPNGTCDVNIASDQERGKTAGDDIGGAHTEGDATVDAHCQAGESGCATWASAEMGTEASKRTNEELAAEAKPVASAGVECASACTGDAVTATNAVIAAGVKGDDKLAMIRATDADTSCTVTSGACEVSVFSATDPGETGADPTTAERFRPTATSEGGSSVDCLTASCEGEGKAATAGEARGGDIEGVRDSEGLSSCTAYGSGASCDANSDTQVTNRTLASDSWSEPVSMSHADSTLSCAQSPACGGDAYSETSARDTAVSPHRRGSSASGDCTVAGGGCLVETNSDASTASDYSSTHDSGPSSASHSSAALDCPNGCDGVVHTSSSAWDGPSKKRASANTASCAAGAGPCQARITSTASSGPSGTHVANNEGFYPASGSSSVTPAVGDGAAGQASSAVKQEMGTSSGGERSTPSATPLVELKSAKNAIVTAASPGDHTSTGDRRMPTGGQGSDHQPAAPPAPSPSASPGGSTVPGGSLWLAKAVLNHDGGLGGYRGTILGAAEGFDRPSMMNGGGGARGPPATDETGATGCHRGDLGCVAHQQKPQRNRRSSRRAGSTARRRTGRTRRERGQSESLPARAVCTTAPDRAAGDAPVGITPDSGRTKTFPSFFGAPRASSTSGCLEPRHAGPLTGAGSTSDCLACRGAYRVAGGVERRAHTSGSARSPPHLLLAVSLAAARDRLAMSWPRRGRGSTPIGTTHIPDLE